MIPTMLDKKIKIVTNNELGGLFSNNGNQKVIKTMYANLMNFSNSESVQAYSKDETILVSFRVIYTKFTKQIPYKTKEYQILYNDRLYDIIDAIPKSKNYIDIKCKVVI